MWDHFTFDLSHFGFDHHFNPAADTHDMGINSSHVNSSSDDTSNYSAPVRHLHSYQHVSDDSYDPTLDHDDQYYEVQQHDDADYTNITPLKKKQDFFDSDDIFAHNNSELSQHPFFSTAKIDHSSIGHIHNPHAHDLFLETPDGNYEDIGIATENLDGGNTLNTVVKSIGSRIVTYTDHNGDGFVDAINEISTDGTTMHYDLIDGKWVRRSA